MRNLRKMRNGEKTKMLTFPPIEAVNHFQKTN